MNPIIDYCSVFSAHAEVVPMLRWWRLSHPRILRARGGSSLRLPGLTRIFQVFSAHAEVVPAF